MSTLKADRSRQKARRNLTPANSGALAAMNKTWLLLDVTQTYEVTDSHFELAGDTAQEPRVQDET